MKFDTGLELFGLSKEVEEELQGQIYGCQMAFQNGFIDLCEKHNVGEHELDIDEYNKGKLYIATYIAISDQTGLKWEIIEKSLLKTFRNIIRKAVLNKKKAKRLIRNCKNYKFQTWVCFNLKK